MSADNWVSFAHGEEPGVKIAGFNIARYVRIQFRKMRPANFVRMTVEVHGHDSTGKLYGFSENPLSAPSQSSSDGTTPADARPEIKVEETAAASVAEHERFWQTFWRCFCLP